MPLRAGFFAGFRAAGFLAAFLATGLDAPAGLAFLAGAGFALDGACADGALAAGLAGPIAFAAISSALAAIERAMPCCS